MNLLLHLVLLLAQTISGTVTLSGDITCGSSAATATVLLSPNAGQVGNYANSKQSPTLAFGKQGISTASMAIPISVNNCSTPAIAACTGTGSVTVSSMTVSGTNASDFTITGTCSTIASGADCSPTITFTPTASTGTAETATFTEVDNSGTHTMAMTGTSATVTTFSSTSQTFSSNTNYQLTSNLSCAASCLTVGSVSNVDINLNGHSLTYCASSSSSYVGGVIMTGNPTTSLTVHNGSILHGAGSCTGVTTLTGFGSGVVVASNDNGSNASWGTALANLYGTFSDPQGKLLFEEDEGDTVSESLSMHDVSYLDSDATICSSVGCRANDQFYPVVVDQAQHAAPQTFYNIIGVGGTQGALTINAPGGSSITNVYINPGNVTVTNTNGFVAQDFTGGATIENNLTAGTGIGGACLSCRGIQVSSAANVVVTGTLVAYNYQHVTTLMNSAEYGSPTGTPNGCALGGTYAFQINTAGSGYDLSNNTFEYNTGIVTAGDCPGVGFSFSNATNGSGPNHTLDNHFECDLNSGSTAYPCVGMQLIAGEYTPYPDGSIISTGDTILGDTSALYVGYNGTSSWTCNQCTFGKGTNPVSSGWVLLDYDGGLSSGSGSSPFTLIDPTFTGGAVKSSNNLATWASNNHTLSFYYMIQWTYTVTVEQSSNSAPISGATVTLTDTDSTVECTGSTNGSGVYSCPVNDTKYGAASGTYAATSYNPFSISIVKSGCTTLGYSESFTATTSETKQLAGC